MSLLRSGNHLSQLCRGLTGSQRTASSVHLLSFSRNPGGAAVNAGTSVLQPPRRHLALGWDHQAWIREDLQKQKESQLQRNPRFQDPEYRRMVEEEKKTAWAKKERRLNPQKLPLVSVEEPRTPLATYRAELREANNYRCEWLRSQGRLPGSLHFKNDPLDKKMINFHIELARFEEECRTIPGIWNRVFKLELPDREEPLLVIPQNIHIQSVTRKPIHIQVREFIPFEPVNVKLPIIPINTSQSPGLRSGGWLHVITRQLRCVWSGDEYVPTTIKVDLSDVRVRQRKRLYDVTLPEGLVPVRPERNVTLVMVRGRPRDDDEDEEEAMAAAPAGNKS